MSMDYLSMDGETTIAKMWHKYGEIIAPMGCVTGKSVIDVEYTDVYTNKSLRDTCSFSSLWNLIGVGRIETNGIHPQAPNSLNLYADPSSLYIWDSKANKYVKVLRVIRNVNKEWLQIGIYGRHCIRYLDCTKDHPLPIIRDGKEQRIFAKDIVMGDRIMIYDVKGEYRDKDNLIVSGMSEATIRSIDEYSMLGYSYDVTTETDRFVVNGISSHNCRAFLSPYYERGGMEPADENDRPFFTGRFNIGVVSLNLPMIYAKAKKEGEDFYTVLDEYLELIREVHIKTYEYLGELKASTNPIAFCQGGVHGGFLSPKDKIKPLLKYTTASFGITALNELNRLHNKKSIREDGEFPLEVMKHINDKVNQFKKEDGILYAIYGSPAESLCYKQVEQFRKMYGIVENVSDREYVSNSFHCHVSEEMDGVEKQDKEARFWDYLQGGRIQYVRYNTRYNTDAIKTYVRRAMKMGLYEGVNFALCYCEDCGHDGTSFDECPKCGSKNIVSISRMNGYLSYSRVHGDTRLNHGKMAEIADRKSM